MLWGDVVHDHGCVAEAVLTIWREPGTPRLLSRARPEVRQARRESAIIIRDEANSPLLSAESTAVKITPFMICAAPVHTLSSAVT
jgi:hypothetical protein